MYLVYSIVSCVVLFVVKWLVEQWKFYKKLENIKGPKPLPILGNVLDLLSPTEMLPSLHRYNKEFGDIYKIFIGPIYTYIIVTDCDVLEYIMGSNKLIEKSHDYEYIKNWLGNGLITAPGHIWRKFRKSLTPAFHFKILEKMVDEFDKPGDILVKKLKKECEAGQKEVDIYDFITLYSLDVICESAMGISIDAQQQVENSFVQSTRKMLQIIAGRVFSFYKQFHFLYQFTGDYQHELKSLKVLHGTTNDVIKQRRAELKNKIPDTNIDEFGIKEKKVFLDLMLNLKVDGKPIEDHHIRHNVETIMFAGHDTTASAISFALYCLSNHPEIQQKVYEEIESVMGDAKDRNPTHTELNEMRYLEMVLKETLRLYPSVHMIARSIKEDFEFKGILFPKGSTIGICPYLSHRRPDIYPDPEKFDPERFTVDSQAKRHPYAYIPFSAGPRNCIGQKFAMLSAKSAICKVVSNFELLPTTNKKVVLSAEIILKSQNGVHMKLQKR